MSQSHRLPTGGLIDRDRRLAFRWEGRALSGYAGDTLASALVANGMRLVGRSFKYHRPRGLLAAGAEEPNALVQLGEGARSTPNARATEVPLHDGLVARPVNCWPSARFDFMGASDRLSGFLGAGFYYKMFKWPDWRLFEGAIRRAAGLGRVSAAPDPDRYESRYAHCDVLVVGAGPAGLAAGRAAAATGARVILAEQDTVPGGALLFEDAMIDGLRGFAWAARTWAEIAARPEARALVRTTVVGYHDHNSFTLIEEVGNEAECAADTNLPRARMWIVRAKRAVLATGAIERPLVFGGNDRPGVMLASASRAYVRRWAALPGRRAVVFGNNDSVDATVAALAGAGVNVSAVVDARPDIAPERARALDGIGARLIAGAAVVATRGRHALTAVQVRDAAGRSEWISCDHLAMSGGWNPTVHLFSQSGGELAFDDALVAYVPRRSAQAETSVGAAAGALTTAAALAQGHAAGRAAAIAAGFTGGSVPTASVAAEEPPPAPPIPLWRVEGGRGKAFVDFQNDVAEADIALAHREGYGSVEQLKRYTTLGMAPDQGKTANVNGLAVLGLLTGRTPGETGHTRYRFPYTPVPLGAFAGRNRGELYRPLRRMPAHDRHIAAGAMLEEYGGWLRPSAYRRSGERAHAAEQREARTVRETAGLFEASPLGKIEVVGPDAARFLDLVYANAMSTLKEGRVRYGLMLSEAGVVLDDGVAARLGRDHFLVCTSSAGADHIAAWMDEWRQCEWPGLDLVIAPVTSAWGVLTLTGPAARTILRAVGTSIDLDAFPHMAWREGEVAGLPVRALRVSYTGELSFELNVPARRAPELWDALMSAGTPFGLAPTGIDAWMVLRTEKGYLHVGGDTDGTTNALDVGWVHVLARDVHFIGKRSLSRANDQRSDRLQLVGFQSDTLLPVGGHVPAPETGSQGYVTSSVMSPALGRPVALGMLRNGRARLGERVRVIDANGGAFGARVVQPAFYDPAGERLRG